MRKAEIICALIQDMHDDCQMADLLYEVVEFSFKLIADSAETNVSCINKNDALFRSILDAHGSMTYPFGHDMPDEGEPYGIDNEFQAKVLEGLRKSRS